MCLDSAGRALGKACAGPRRIQEWGKPTDMYSAGVAGGRSTFKWVSGSGLVGSGDRDRGGFFDLFPDLAAADLWQPVHEDSASQPSASPLWLVSMHSMSIQAGPSIQTTLRALKCSGVSGMSRDLYLLYLLPGTFNLAGLLRLQRRFLCPGPCPFGPRAGQDLPEGAL